MSRLLIFGLVGALLGGALGAVCGVALLAAVAPEYRLWFVGLCATVTGVTGAAAAVVSVRARASSGDRFKPTLAAVLGGGCAGAFLAQWLFGYTPGGKQLVFVFLGAIAGGCAIRLFRRFQDRRAERLENAGVRRWFQFALGSLLSLIVIASLLLALWVRGPIRRRQILTAIEVSGGGHVRYASRTPDWVVGMLGAAARGVFDEVDEMVLNDATDADIARIAVFTRLRALAIGGNGDAVTDRAMETIVHLESLEELQLGGTMISSKGLAQLKRLPRLKSLVLPECTNDEGLKEVGALTGLERLDMMGGFMAWPRPESWGPLGSNGWANLANLTQLNELILIQVPIGDNDLAFVEGLTRLKRLELPASLVTDAGLHHLQRLEQLEVLNLKKAGVTGSGFAQLESLARLRSLDLGATPFNDQGMGHIANLANIDMLNLYDTKITDDGLAPLKRLTKLVWLNISGTAITDAGARHLEDITSLFWWDLNFSGTQVSREGKLRLKAAVEKRQRQRTGSE